MKTTSAKPSNIKFPTALLLASLACMASHAKTEAEKLGFPAGKKIVIDYRNA